MLLTIGHSTHPVALFLDRLRAQDITVLVDVRSSPYSRFNPQFNRETLKRDAETAGIVYVHLGEALGPRTADDSCYVEDRVQYDRLAATPRFAEGLARLRELMARDHVALVCAEGDPLLCHRFVLVCRALRDDGADIRHIGPDGGIESQREAEERLLSLWGLGDEDLFADRENRVQCAYDLQGQRIAYRRSAGFSGLQAGQAEAGPGGPESMRPSRGVRRESTDNRKRGEQDA